MREHPPRAGEENLSLSGPRGPVNTAGPEEREAGELPMQAELCWGSAWPRLHSGTVAQGSADLPGGPQSLSGGC